MSGEAGVAVAVDFGTSSTVAAIRRGHDLPVLLDFDGERVLPSTVFADGDLIVVGRTAEALLPSAPALGLRGVKALVGKGHSTVLGGRAFATAELVASVLEAALAVARVHAANRWDRLVLTYPADWSRRQLNDFEDAADRACGGGAELLPEPLAAAGAFPPEVFGDAPALVFDLGAGTLDTATIRARDAGVIPAGAGSASSLVLLGHPGGDRRLGGDLLDELILTHFGENELSASDWAALCGSEQQPWVRAMLLLRREVRAAKELLSRRQEVEIVAALPTGIRTAMFTRNDAAHLFQPVMEQAMIRCAGTVAAAGVAPEELETICLVGGGSQLPLIHSALREAFPRAALRSMPDPRVCAAVGALLLDRAPSSARPAEQKPRSPGEVGGPRRAESAAAPREPVPPPAILDAWHPAGARPAEAPPPSPTSTVTAPTLAVDTDPPARASLHRPSFVPQPETVVELAATRAQERSEGASRPPESDRDAVPEVRGIPVTEAPTKPDSEGEAPFPPARRNPAKADSTPTPARLLPDQPRPTAFAQRPPLDEIDAFDEGPAPRPIDGHQPLDVPKAPLPGEPQQRPPEPPATAHSVFERIRIVDAGERAAAEAIDPPASAPVPLSHGLNSTPTRSSHEERSSSTRFTGVSMTAASADETLLDVAHPSPQPAETLLRRPGAPPVRKVNRHRAKRGGWPATAAILLVVVLIASSLRLMLSRGRQGDDAASALSAQTVQPAEVVVASTGPGVSSIVEAEYTSDSTALTLALNAEEFAANPSDANRVAMNMLLQEFDPGLLQRDYPLGSSAAHISVSESGDLVALTFSQIIELWNPRTRTLTRSLAYSDSHTFVESAFTPDGLGLVTIDVFDERVLVWDITDGTVAKELVTNVSLRDPRSLSVSPTGDLVAVSDSEGHVVVWSLSTGISNSSPADIGVVEDVQFRANHDSLALCAGSLVRLVDPVSGDSIQTIILSSEEGESWCNDIAFSPDGALLLVARRNGWVEMWDVATSSQMLVITDHLPDFFDPSASSVTFAPDGRAFAARLSTVTIAWDVEHGTQLEYIDPGVPSPSPKGLAYLPSGDALLYSSASGNIVHSPQLSARQACSLLRGRLDRSEVIQALSGRPLDACTDLA